MPHKDPDVRRAYHREYKRRNRYRYVEREKAWAAARHANQRAAKYGADGTVTPAEAREILALNRCEYCGVTADVAQMSLDHVEPIHDGGANRPQNIVCCCRSCNARKYRREHPGCWSVFGDLCIDCGTDRLRHAAAGRCISCYGRWRMAAQRDGTFRIRQRTAPPPHGTRRRYRWVHAPCRCSECRAAMARRAVEARRKKKAAA